MVGMAAGGWVIGMTVARRLRWKWCRRDGVGSEAVRMVACHGRSGVVEMVASWRLENLAGNGGGAGGRKNREERELGASSDLFVGSIYAKTAFEMLSDLKETYDKVDGSAVFNLHKSVNSLNENGAPFAEYYNNMNSLWKQFDAMISLPTCTCEAAKHFEEHNQLIKLMQFLMGVDEIYLAIKSNILTREILPLVKAAFAIISGEESHRNVTSVRASKPAATTFIAKTFDNKRSKQLH
ncbi:hypothetical protein Tco_0625713 [Tanacetum coccineum]|uniref:Uncharacterized protein n=1 Tax=Tanacetum coccineum TaxID=301880 RepID=A0ABQ4WHK8_9ASTR